ncbi:von Willebrand factor type A domain-containing protein [uncultured Winogradskyella sp.]|uniref:vWA domain-containing protein n=1 Tax=uncultured Winogradskyella sp. TaxID=395353 RepID=UPI00263273AC|nr:von Willebrand factor type A domain-containing protein [uncultured Winogradskyella sp.]
MKAKPFKSVIKFSIIFVLILLFDGCYPPNGQSKNAMYELDDIEVYEVTTDEVTIIEHNTEEYDRIYENTYRDVRQNPLSTFSIDVDNASYSNVRRFLSNNQLPPKDAVRIEEMINYFNYDYPQPNDKHPFSFSNEVADCPWNIEHKLVHIGIQGKSLDYKDIKPSNFVFLIDASGSMSSNNKLPLLKKALKLLLNELNESDKVAIVAYAGSAGLVLPSTKASQKETIIEALDRINSGGSTAGGEGIQLAYKIAKENLITNGNNRVILATDGDFNVGVSSSSEMVRLIEEKRKEDIYLTICGFGMGNYKDGRMEQISNAGNGNYFYIDNIKEAKKVFSTDMRANMFTIAKDVKIQIEFNPSQVKAYRLIGYENRVMKNEDFNNDKKDAGELGAGHTVTALYEVVPFNSKYQAKQHDALKYQKTETTVASNNNEMLTIKFRYKKPKDNKSILITKTIEDKSLELEKASNNFKFSSAVAGFGLLLRDSKYKGDITYTMAKELALNAKGNDVNGYRQELISLIETAALLTEKL